MEDYAIRARPTVMASTLVHAHARFAEAAARGEAADIFVAGGGLWDEADKGYLAPLDECIKAHPEFANIRSDLFSMSRNRGHVWGIPINMNFYGLYFNKALLRRLGWPETRIEALPDHIRSGAFTLDDLLATAREAIRQGLVEPGYGLWLDTNPHTALAMLYRAHGGRLSSNSLSVGERLSLQREVWSNTLRTYHALFADGITHTQLKSEHPTYWYRVTLTRDAHMGGQVLFWVDAADARGVYALDKVQSRGGQDYLRHDVGFALFPGQHGEQPSVFFGGGAFYAIAADKATGGRGNQDAACALLAKMMTPELNDLHIARSGSGSVLSTPPTNEEARFGHEVAYMLDYGWNSWFAPQFVAYAGILVDFARRAAAGDESVEQLADQTAERMRVLLGDEVLIE